MSEITCEICGSTYPDTESECPVCGFHRSTTRIDLDAASGEDRLAAFAEEPGVNTRANGAKGGRFAKKNVEKHQKEEDLLPSMEEPPRSGRGAGLKILVTVLAVCVAAVSCYIGYRFWKGAAAYQEPSEPVVTEVSPSTQPSETATQPQTEPTQPKETGIPCTDVMVSNTEVTLDGPGRGWLLGVKAFPEDTTDELQFASSDEAVAEVSDSGRITSVGPGTATITISCGQIVRECVVTCTFDGAEPSQPEETTDGPDETTAPTQSGYKDNNWTLSNKWGDATLIIGESFTLELRNEAGEVADVQWQSSNRGVVSIDGNVITGKVRGTTDVTASIGGETYTCIVRVISGR